MADIEISKKIHLELPANVAAQQRPVGTRGRRGERMDVLDGALTDADLTVEAVIELTPVPSRRDRRGRTLRAEPEDTTKPILRVDVEPTEGAVALLESEGGVFAWLAPDEPTLSTRRGGAVRTLEFTLANPAQSAGAAPGMDRRGRRGIVSWIGNQLLDPIRVRVLTFAANVAIDKIMDRIEGDRTFGLVDMSGPASGWRPGAKLPEPDDGGPSRVLLMVHGTFSSSAGSFGALELTKSGGEFLKVAREYYGAILGFDHKTLAEDPEQNARSIMEALKSLPKNAVIDAIAFSRGGLVYRALAERIAPEVRPDLKFDRAIFVGCTNAGTHLAKPDNWAELIDLYTNIVMAGARAITMLSANAAAEIVASGISSIGRLVKYIPQIAIEKKRVPGLAAMEPGGEFVSALNEADPKHGGRAYHVIATDFEPRIEPSKGITGELAEYLIDRIVDRLFKDTDNDLVVDTESMWDFGKQNKRLGDEARILIPSEDSVYHTVYFAAERVGELLGGWLRPPMASMAASEPEPEPEPSMDDYVEYGGGGGVGISLPSLGGEATELTHTGFDTGSGGISGDGIAGGAGDYFEGGGIVPRRRGRGGGLRGRVGVGGRTGRTLRKAAPPTVVDVEEPAEPEVEPAGGIACHFAAEMQPTPVVGLPVPLFVTVSPERISVAAGPAAAATERAVSVDEMKQIEVEVIPSRNCRMFGVEDGPARTSEKREEGPSLRKIDVPTKGAVSLRFEIEGIAPGEADIFIEARQESRLLASFLLKPVFTLQSDARISASQIARPTLSGQDDPAVLRILETRKSDGVLRLRFELSCENPNILLQQDWDLTANFNVGAFVSMFLTKLEEAYDLKNYDDMLAEITNFSISCTQDLMPEKIRQRLWEHRNNIKAIQVISEEPLIPWELLYIADPSGQSKDRQGFLAEWGLVRWMYNAPWPRRSLPLRSDRVFYVIPDYLHPDNILEGAEEERKMLAKRFPGATGIEPKSSQVRKFLRDQAAECDLLHFACHGLADQKAVLSSDLIMRETERDGELIDDRISQHDVRVEATFNENAPAGIVLVNACQTGRVGEGIAGVMGFADSFIRPMSQQGASVFVGALWSINDGLALTFVDTFYDQLLNKDATLVGAAHEAREACKQNEDFTWLAYSLYGHPFARVAK